jgi:ribosomal protein S18 acetylase RimI-like enzyme
LTILRQIARPVAWKSFPFAHRKNQLATSEKIALINAPSMNITLAIYNDESHRDQVSALWESVFAYETAHNRPGLVIDKKRAVNDDLFFVALSDNKVVGTVMAGYDGHRGWIYSVAVSPSHRRQGLGSQLVSHAERALIAKGCVKINLQIMQGNESVTAFYAALGFSVEKRISMGKPISENIPPVGRSS